MTRRVVALLSTAIATTVGAPALSSPAAAADDVQLVLTDQPFVIAADQPWTATFRVIGDLGDATPTTTSSTTTATPTTMDPATSVVDVPPATSAAAAPAGPTVVTRVLVHRLVDDRAALAAALDGDPGPLVSRVTVPAALAPDSGQTTLAVDVPTTTDPNVADALVMRLPGLYPLTVQLMVDGAVVATHDTFVERLPTEHDATDARMNVAILATAADPGPQPSASELAAGRDELDAIATTAAAIGGPMTVEIPPVLVRDLDADDPDLLGSLRTSLAQAEVLAVPAEALDPSSAAGSGQQDAFSRQLLEGEDVLTGALPGSPPQRSAWLSPTPISEAGAAMLRDPLGFDLLVLGTDVYDSLDGSIKGYHDPTLTFDVDLGDQGSLPGVVPSPSSRWLDRDELDRRGIASTDAAVAIMSELLVARRELGPQLGRSAILTTPPGVVPDAEVAATLARYVAATPDFMLAPLSAVPATTDAMVIPDRGPEVVRLPDVAGPDLTQRARRIDLTRLYAAGAGSMLPDDTQLDEWNAELDELLSTGLDDATVDAQLQQITEEATAVYDRVVAPRPFTLTLTGRSSTLRLNMRNNGPDVLRVVVRPSSPKLTFPDGEQTVDLVPGGVTEVVIPVEARANGTAAIGVEVLTPAFGQTVEGPVVLTAHVNALSGLGQVVTGAALLVLVSWWYGHFRRRRRVRRALLGEVDNPSTVETAALSPDAAEATATTSGDTASVSDP